ncbi:hypothetical protein [Streptomyces sp. NPDC096351]|uniref:hypothetical protein n=1 Tax=Streptomyces sp. NPDC096351 TaxID=3366087 RepID=UPI0038174B71
MYGQVPAPAPPPRAAGPSAATITVRVLITVLVVLSLGFLAWVAMLRIAIMRRTGRDWTLFWAQLVLNVGCVVPLEQRFAGTWMNTAGMIVLLVQMAIVTCYFLVVDIRHHQPAPVVIMVPSPSSPPHGPHGQGQVQGYAYGTPQPGYAVPGYAAPGHAAPGYGYPPAAVTAPAPGSRPGPHPAPGPQPAPAHPASAPHPYAPAPPAGQAPPPPGRTPDASPAPDPGPAPHPLPGRAPRIDQVRAELDELSDLLRQSGEGDGRA